MTANTTASELFTLLTDDEAVKWIIKQVEGPNAVARQIIDGFRKKARQHGVADSVRMHAEAPFGCTFKHSIPWMGPCSKGFQYLQGWDFSDPQTEHSLLSWIPAPLIGSNDKTVWEQNQLIEAFKAEAGLPAWYELSFGSACHVGGLSFAHINATKKDPFAGMTVRTDTRHTDGGRLKLHWYRDCLGCDCFHFDVSRNPHLANFVVGVVKATDQH